MFKQTHSGSLLLCTFIPDINMQNVFNLHTVLQRLFFLTGASVVNTQPKNGISPFLVIPEHSWP